MNDPSDPVLHPEARSAERRALDRWADSALADKLGPTFMVLGKLLRRRIRLALAEAGLGLTAAQARAIVMLHFHGPVSQQTLAALTDVEPSTLVSTLDVMEREGLARRHRNPDDRRAYLVHLTTEGERRVPKLFALWDEVEAELVGDLTAEEQETLREQVLRLIGRLSPGEEPSG